MGLAMLNQCCQAVGEAVLGDTFGQESPNLHDPVPEIVDGISNHEAVMVKSLITIKLTL